jgi:hypothetical protein
MYSMKPADGVRNEYNSWTKIQVYPIVFLPTIMRDWPNSPSTASDTVLFSLSGEAWAHQTTNCGKTTHKEIYSTVLFHITC